MTRVFPTLDLINRIPEGNYKRIIDIGCGTGMSTLPLKNRFTEVEKQMRRNKSLEEYYDILAMYVGDIEIWQTNYTHLMDSYAVFIYF